MGSLRDILRRAHKADVEELASIEKTYAPPFGYTGYYANYGPTGPSGITGVSYFFGATGPSGMFGSQGRQGYQHQGYQGTLGSTGLSGHSSFPNPTKHSPLTFIQKIKEVLKGLLNLRIYF